MSDDKTREETLRGSFEAERRRIERWHAAGGYMQSFRRREDLIVEDLDLDLVPVDREAERATLADAVVERLQQTRTAEVSAPPSAWSPPGIPDFAGAYRECIAALVVSHAPLTWDSVAAWLQETYDPPRRLRRGSGQYADLHPKTVARWARRAQLPHPRRL